MFTRPGKAGTIAATSERAAVQEAIRLLQQDRVTRTAVQRWVCESCGMVHTGPAPKACESCGKDTSIVQQADYHREMRGLG